MHRGVAKTAVYAVVLVFSLGLMSARALEHRGEVSYLQSPYNTAFSERHNKSFRIGWKHNTEAEEHERGDYYVIVGGYGRRLTPDTLLVADLVREEEKVAGHTSNLLELGFRPALSAGVGAGFADESPDIRLTIAVQHSF